jgi:hypothetical protein
MVYMMVKVGGDWKHGLSLEYETEPIELNHIFLTDCGDYNSRVTGFFTGVDAWGKTHRMAAVESFLKRDMVAYLAKYNLPLPCGHAKPCRCAA